MIHKFDSADYNISYHNPREKTRLLFPLYRCILRGCGLGRWFGTDMLTRVGICLKLDLQRSLEYAISSCSHLRPLIMSLQTLCFRGYFTDSNTSSRNLSEQTKSKRLSVVWKSFVLHLSYLFPKYTESLTYILSHARRERSCGSKKFEYCTFSKSSGMMG